MVKPFALAELSARLRAVLRRGAPRENVLRVADLEDGHPGADRSTAAAGRSN